MNTHSYWPYFWFGCWKENGEGYSMCPPIIDFVDPYWKHEHMNEILQYVRSAPIIATTSRIAIPWAIGAGDGRSSISYRTDGVWLWLDDLDYYLMEYSVRIPDAFLAHIEHAGYQPPAEVNVPTEELDWPPVDE